MHYPLIRQFIVLSAAIEPNLSALLKGVFTQWNLTQTLHLNLRQNLLEVSFPLTSMRNLRVSADDVGFERSDVTIEVKI